VLAVAARHDGSGGLRAVLRVLDAHAAPLCAAAAALGAAQAACLVAAAAYGSRPAAGPGRRPMGMRACHMRSGGVLSGYWRSNWLSYSGALHAFMCVFP